MGNQESVEANRRCTRCREAYSLERWSIPIVLECKHTFCALCVKQITRRDDESVGDATKPKSERSGGWSTIDQDGTVVRGRGDHTFSSSAMQRPETPECYSTFRKCPTCNASISRKQDDKFGKVNEEYIEVLKRHERSRSPRRSTVKRKKRRNSSPSAASKRHKRRKSSSSSRSKRDKKRRARDRSTASSSTYKGGASERPSEHVIYGPHIDVPRKSFSYEPGSCQNKKIEENNNSVPADRILFCENLVCCSKCNEARSLKIMRCCVTCSLADNESACPLPLCSDCVLDFHRGSSCMVQKYALVQVSHRYLYRQESVRSGFSDVSSRIGAVIDIAATVVRNIPVPSSLMDQLKLIQNESDERKLVASEAELALLEPLLCNVQQSMKLLEETAKEIIKNQENTDVVVKTEPLSDTENE